MNVSVPARHQFDRRANRWADAGCLLIVVAVCALIVAGLTNMEPIAIVRVLFAVLAVSCVWYAIAYFRQRLVAGADGVEVRTVTRSFSLRWADINHFEMVPFRGTLRSDPRRCLAAITVDGATVRLPLWGQAAYNRPGFAHDVMVELTRLKSIYGTE